MSRNKLNISIIIGLIILGIILFILNLFVGSVSIPFCDLFEVIFGDDGNATIHTIVYEYRLPQAITASLAGAALSVAGLLMQTLFRNPLADPSMLGVSSGSSLGVAVTILLTGILGKSALSSFGLWSNIGVSFAAFLGATLVLMLILGFSSRVRNMTTLIIIGLMISYLSGSITDILKFFSMKEDIHAFVIWGMGTFSAVGPSKILFFSVSIIIGLFASLFLSKNLNILLLGDLYAENLGAQAEMLMLSALKEKEESLKCDRDGQWKDTPQNKHILAQVVQLLIGVTALCVIGLTTVFTKMLFQPKKNR